MRLLVAILFLFLSGITHAQSYFLFIGTYTTNGSKGIYVYRFDAATGKATPVSFTDSIINPSYLTIAPDGQHVYAVTESAMKDTGSVSAFAFDKNSGKLAFMNKYSSGGDNPCYVEITKDGKYVTVGNYTGGSLSAYPVNADGSLQKASQHIQHTGTSIDKSRQDHPHVHCTVFTPDGKYLLVPDLGIDKVMMYKFDPSAAQPLQPAAQPFAASSPGHGPRHITFHPNNQFAYLVEEMSGTVITYQYKNGRLDRLQEIAAHPAEYKGPIGSADIHVSPDGNFLYASNRGDENNIAVFAINKKTGRLTTKGYQSTLGKTPRNFVIDPTGNWLLAANQNTGNIVIIKRDKSTGMLTPTGDEIKIPSPVCLKMLKD